MNAPDKISQNRKQILCPRRLWVKGRVGPEVHQERGLSDGETRGNTASTQPWIKERRVSKAPGDGRRIEKRRGCGTSIRLVWITYNGLFFKSFQGHR